MDFSGFSDKLQERTPLTFNWVFFIVILSGHKPSRIRALRSARGIEAQALAAAAGISSSYLGMIERGTRIPAADVLQKIASHLKVNVGQLMEPGPSAAEMTMAGQLRSQMAQGPGEVGLGRRLKALRAERGVSVRALCDGAAGTAVGLKAWLVREFEIGARVPTEAELELLAGAFGFEGVQDLQGALEEMVAGDPDDGMILSENRAARRLAYDRDSADWAELVLRATSRGFTGDQLVINGNLLTENCDHITRGSMVLVDRSVRVEEGDPVICMNRKEVMGFGRVENATARDAQGAELRGSLWRVVAILYP